MASEVGICNAALQKLGAKRIASLTENSPNARSCAAAYARIRDAELTKHAWSFAIKREVLAPLATTPAFGYAYQFLWPTACLRILPPNRAGLDWKVEGRTILTNEGDTLELPYIQRVIDPNDMTALFQDVLACALAAEMCEEITQSNQKKIDATGKYREVIREARRVNAFQEISAEPPEDTWVLARR